ncbi:uncharacterized protein LOC122252928 [Penaeus japonicus]|uniref:uncharacterized protein LOC122252928 n=1 Tax=Penaeus japonicus TaxID=27405 RepID=UPI001C7153A0|nr:uncharacterized protein LOC122252928 [Penaeus japonicus]
MKLLIAVLLIWCSLSSCKKDHGCILWDTSTERATMKEGLPGTFYLMRDGNLTKVFLRLFMEQRSDGKMKVETIVLSQKDLPSEKSLQKVIVSANTDGDQTFLRMSLPNITERTYDCCPNYEIEKLEVETEGGGLWVFYRCPDAIPKEKLHKMAKLDGCDKGGVPADSGAEAPPIVRASAWAVLTIALACLQLV